MKEVIIGELKGTIYEEGYTKVAKSIWYDENISTDAKALYTFLKVHAGDKDSAFPSKELTMGILHWGEKKYESAKRELVKNGYITASMVRGTKGKFTHTEYYFTKTKQEKRYFKFKMLSTDSPHRNFYGMDEKVGKMDSKPTPAIGDPHRNFYGTAAQPGVAVEGTNINNIYNNNDNTLSPEERELSEVIAHYRGNINKEIVDFEVETLNEFIDRYTAPLVMKAIDRTVMFLVKEKRTIAYVASILKDLKAHNVFTAEQADNYFADYDGKKAKEKAENKQKPKSKPNYTPKPSTFNNHSQRNYDGKENPCMSEFELGMQYKQDLITKEQYIELIYEVYSKTGSITAFNTYQELKTED